MLLQFFGKQYLDYKERVPTGLPFIKGYSGDATRFIRKYKMTSSRTSELVII